MSYNLTIDKKGKVLNPISAYQPSQAVKDFSMVMSSAEQEGEEILNYPFPEFNSMSLIQRLNVDQKAWLSWTPPDSDDPDEAWMWRGIRPITRNKIISTAAHLAQKVIYPTVVAQNDSDEEDRESSYVMKALIEYNMERAHYDQTFLYAVISGLVNPVSYMQVDYCQAYQDILEGTNSEYTRKRVLDSVLSGFKHNLIPAEEILITNAYVFNFQMQPNYTRRRRISYDEAEALHGTNENFKHVKAGSIAVMGPDGLFYDVEDAVGDGLVCETTYYNRRGDCEATKVNGIYLSNPNVDFNPIKHRDNENKPKYNVVKYGSEPIDAMRFWAYKSLAGKLSNDQELADRMYQTFVDASQLEAYKPTITTGAGGAIDRSVVVPSAVTDLPSGATITPINGVSNPQAALLALQAVEKSMNESSQDPSLSGVNSGDKETATKTQQIQENAQTNLNIQYTMMAAMVTDVSELMVDDILRYQTVGEVAEILGGVPKMKYKSFLLSNKVKNGRTVNEYIHCTDRFAGETYSKEDIEQESLKMATVAGPDREIHEVNPPIFAKRKFLIKCTADMMAPLTGSALNRYKLAVYDRAIANPNLDQEAITRDFLLEPLVKGDASMYMKTDAQKALQGLVPAEGASKGAMKPTQALQKVGTI